jgi:isopentenyl phosphate kinase
MVYGDVVFDEAIGGTILSTEELFVYLAKKLTPGRILLAGVEEGVWGDYPIRSQLLRDITPMDLESLLPHLGGAEGHDVTGGMAEKVRMMAAIVREMPELEVVIFSGEKPGMVRKALEGDPVGTCISQKSRRLDASG